MIGQFLMQIPQGQPVLSIEAHWTGVVMIGVAALFLAGMVIGPILKLHEVPDESGHHSHHSH